MPLAFLGLKKSLRRSLLWVLHCSPTGQERPKTLVLSWLAAGKSSMLTCLFRLTELCGGRVVIDNVDISGVGLRQLRSRLGIIPQVGCDELW